jgi:hypothetical protein
VRARLGICRETEGLKFNLSLPGRSPAMTAKTYRPDLGMDMGERAIAGP